MNRAERSSMKRTGMMVGLLLGAAYCGYGEGWTVTIKGQSRAGMEATLSGSSHAHEKAADYLPGRGSDSGYGWDRSERPSLDLVNLPGDDIATYADRSFDNGFVNESPPTEATGFTWYWGFDSADQYDAGSQTLSFTRDTAVNATRTYTDTAEGRRSLRDSQVMLDREALDRERFDGQGALIEVSRAWLGGERGDIDWVLGIGLLEGDSLTLSDRTYEAQVEQRNYRTYASEIYEHDLNANYRETSTYADPNGVVPGATPPYEGTYDGPGPVINNLPATRDVQSLGSTVNQATRTSRSSGESLLSVDRWDVRNDISVDLDMEMVTLHAGLKSGLRLGKRARVFLQGQVALNYVTAALDRRETLRASKDGGAASTLATWRDDADEDAWAPSLGIQAGLDLLLGPTWYITSTAGYEYFLDEETFEVGPSRVKLDLSSFQASVGLGRSF